MDTRPQLKPIHGYLAALTTALVWAGFIILGRLGGKTGLTGWDIVALRLGVASLVLLPFSLNFPPGTWRNPRLWVMASLGGLMFLVFVYAGFKYAPAAHGGVLLPGIQGLLITAIGWSMLGQRPSRQRLWGLVPITLGVACIATPQFSGPPSPDAWLGDALLLGASLAWAGYSVLVQRWAFDGWLLTRFVALSTSLVYLPVYALFLPKGLDTVPVSMLVIQGLYQGLGPTILAMVLFLKAVAILGAERTGAIVALVPVITGLAAVQLLGESLSIWLVAGLALVSTGAFLSARAH
jgi:drug/metabolite transporter (DMT)-like permease